MEKSCGDIGGGVKECGGDERVLGIWRLLLGCGEEEYAHFQSVRIRHCGVSVYCPLGV